ncbi:MAG: Lrp/AsnC family transcriptional regulator [Spirochaetes bacterium]|nr:MAG: Lrp/AsnC family transcriptional regulator [Spirochaetota bacterium]
MINAYILINMEPGNSNRALNEIKKIKNISKISIVAGDYDIIVRVQVKTLEDLLKVTNKIHMIKGVLKTTTQVIEKEIGL